MEQKFEQRTEFQCSVKSGFLLEFLAQVYNIIVQGKTISLVLLPQNKILAHIYLSSGNLLGDSGNKFQ